MMPLVASWKLAAKRRLDMQWAATGATCGECETQGDYRGRPYPMKVRVRVDAHNTPAVWRASTCGSLWDMWKQCARADYL